MCFGTRGIIRCWANVETEVESSSPEDRPARSGLYRIPGARFQALSPPLTDSFYRQRMRRADLRNRLVSVIATGHRILRGISRRPARHLHGWYVPREPPASALRQLPPASAPRL